MNSLLQRLLPGEPEPPKAPSVYSTICTCGKEISLDHLQRGADLCTQCTRVTRIQHVIAATIITMLCLAMVWALNHAADPATKGLIQ